MIKYSIILAPLLGVLVPPEAYAGAADYAAGRFMTSAAQEPISSIFLEKGPSRTVASKSEERQLSGLHP